MATSKQRLGKNRDLLLGPEPGLGWQEGRGWLPQASREGDRWKTVVKQKVPSLSFSLDQQGTQYEGSQPASTARYGELAGARVPEMHSRRNQRCCRRRRRREKRAAMMREASPRPSASETPSITLSDF